MSLLSSLFGDDGTIRLTLPAVDQGLGLAWIRSVGRPPESEALGEAAAAWIESRVDDPFRARLRRAVAEDALSIETVPRREAPTPPREALSRFSEEGWEERFARATHVVAVHATADPSWPPVAAWLALVAAAGIAHETGGLVMDPAIPRFIPRAGGTERVPGDGRYLVSDHVVVSISPERDDRGWLTTLGMSRFGLPEIELKHVPLAHGGRAAWLAQAIALRMVEVTVATPVDDEDDVRRIEMDAELALRARDVAAARGEDDDGDASFARPALVRLRHRSTRRGLGFLTVGPPDGGAGADEWLSSTLDALVP